MATVTGLTAERMEAIEDASIVSGAIDGSGHLILTNHGGGTIDAGSALPALPTASDTVKGIVELATDAETSTGTDATRAVTPHGLTAAVGSLVPSATTSVQGKVELATDTETITGTDATRAVTPHGLHALIAAIFPIGAIYTATVSTNPAAILGVGTWTALTGRVLIGADGTFVAGTTGGATTHSLSTANLPIHQHTFSATTSGASNDHSHLVGRDTDGGSGTSRFTVHNSGVSGATGTSPTGGQNADHSHTLSGNTGNGGFANTAINHMPPWRSVYMWERTA